MQSHHPKHLTSPWTRASICTSALPPICQMTVAIHPSWELIKSIGLAAMGSGRLV